MRRARSSLSTPERTILRRLSRGHTRATIAATLAVSKYALRIRLRRLVTKLEAKNLTHATVAAIRQRLI